MKWSHPWFFIASSFCLGFGVSFTGYVWLHNPSRWPSPVREWNGAPTWAAWRCCVPPRSGRWMGFYGCEVLTLAALVRHHLFRFFHLLDQVWGVLGLGFLKLGKFFTRMLKLRMTFGILVFRPIVLDFTLAAGIHSLFSSRLNPAKTSNKYKWQMQILIDKQRNLIILSCTVFPTLFLKVRISSKY